MKPAVLFKFTQHFAIKPYNCVLFGQSKLLLNCSRSYSSSGRIKVAKKCTTLVTAGIFCSSLAVGITKLSSLWEVPQVLAEEAPGDNEEVLPIRQRHKFNFIADVVERVSPAVVHLEIQERHPFNQNSLTLSNGSGFIIREDGLILTNAHVVANKHHVVVKLNDGRSFEGIVQAVDPISDLATVKIKASNLPIIPLGKSSTLRPGEFVVAIGCPFQLSNTVTAGIVSSISRKSRDLGLNSKDMDYIQTDAVINFGNSGGPLVNMDGEAIGINTMKVTTGISFAIPSDYAQTFLSKAETLEHRAEPSKRFGSNHKSSGPSTGTKRRYMGISMLSLTPDVITQLRAQHEGSFPDVTGGVLIHKVVVGSPAYSGGLHPGDVITHVNNIPISSASDIYRNVEQQAELCMTVRRKKDTIHLTVIGEEPFM